MLGHCYWRPEGIEARLRRPIGPRARLQCHGASDDMHKSFSQPYGAKIEGYVETKDENELIRHQKSPF